MFPVVLYKHAKKSNSTLRPNDNTEKSTFQCVLKQDTSVINPTILIGGVDIPKDYNYAYIETFERYYYITDIRWVSPNWEITLTVDSLASWKLTIGNHNLYITRSANQHDGLLMDTLYPTKSEPALNKQTIPTPWNVSGSALIDGTYAVTLIGNNQPTVNLFSFTAYGLLLFGMFSTDYAEELTNSFSKVFDTLQWQANPMQYIASVTWFPFEDVVTGNTEVKVGYINVTTPNRQIQGNAIVEHEKTIIPPKHPQSSLRGDYLNNAPYSDYTLYYPPFGELKLDSDIMAQTTSLSLKTITDYRTGLCTLKVRSNPSDVLMLTSENKIGIPLQVAQIGKSNAFDLSNIASIGTGAIKDSLGGSIAGMITGGVSAIGDYAKSKIPSSRSKGSNGGMGSLQGDIELITEFKLVVDDDNTNRGRPLCKKKVINSLNGYMMVSDADLSIPCTPQEMQEIKANLEGGFYYE